MGNSAEVNESNNVTIIQTNNYFGISKKILCFISLLCLFLLFLGYWYYLTYHKEDNKKILDSQVQAFSTGEEGLRIIVLPFKQVQGVPSDIGYILTQNLKQSGLDNNLKINAKYLENYDLGSINKDSIKSVLELQQADLIIFGELSNSSITNKSEINFCYIASDSIALVIGQDIESSNRNYQEVNLDKMLQGKITSTVEQIVYALSAGIILNDTLSQDNDYKKALSLIAKSKENSNSVPNLVLDIENILLMYFEQYSKVISNKLILLKDYEKSKDTIQQAITNTDLCALYHQIRQNHKALLYGERALALRTQIYDEPKLAIVHNKLVIASIYRDMNNYPKALKVQLEAKRDINHPYCTPTFSTYAYKGYVYYNIAISYYLMKNRNEAKKWIDSSIIKFEDFLCPKNEDLYDHALDWQEIINDPKSNAKDVFNIFRCSDIVF